MRLSIILLILFLSACTTQKPIEEHRLIVSVIKNIIYPIIIALVPNIISLFVISHSIIILHLIRICHPILHHSYLFLRKISEND